jgi:hypothetical protein
LQYITKKNMEKQMNKKKKTWELLKLDTKVMLWWWLYEGKQQPAILNLKLASNQIRLHNRLRVIYLRNYNKPALLMATCKIIRLPALTSSDIQFRYANFSTR